MLSCRLRSYSQLGREIPEPDFRGTYGRRLSIHTLTTVKEDYSRRVTVVGRHPEGVLVARGYGRILRAYRTGRSSSDICLTPLIVDDVDASTIRGIEPCVIG